MAIKPARFRVDPKLASLLGELMDPLVSAA
jgi:hypothetical protein